MLHFTFVTHKFNIIFGIIIIVWVLYVYNIGNILFFRVDIRDLKNRKSSFALFIPQCWQTSNKLLLQKGFFLNVKNGVLVRYPLLSLSNTTPTSTLNARTLFHKAFLYTHVHNFFVERSPYTVKLFKSLQLSFIDHQNDYHLDVSQYTQTPCFKACLPRTHNTKFMSPIL